MAATILAVAVMATGYLFMFGQTDLERSGYEHGALQAAGSKMEQLRSLPSTDPELEGAPPPGRIHPSGAPMRVILDDRGTEAPEDDRVGYLRWMVTDLDDPADGTGDGADYKEVRVEVAGDASFEEMFAVLRALVCP